MNISVNVDNPSVLLSFDSVGVAYPEGHRFFPKYFWALKEVSLTLRKGETLGVLGRNGAGKSTLLKLLAGIISESKGRIYRKDGINTSLLALQAGFIPSLSGKENAVLSCLLLGMPHKVALSRCDEIFNFAELMEAKDKPLSTYSMGMRARLGFSIAMEADPDILLIDEVLGVGDKSFREKSRTLLIEKISRERSVVIVSHDLNTIRTLCDRAVYIKEGCTVIEGDVGDVISIYEADT